MYLKNLPYQERLKIWSITLLENGLQGFVCSFYSTNESLLV